MKITVSFVGRPAGGYYYLLGLRPNVELTKEQVLSCAVTTILEVSHKGDLQEVIDILSDAEELRIPNEKTNPAQV